MLAEQIKVIQKELSQLDKEISSKLGIADECPFKKEADE